MLFNLLPSFFIHPRRHSKRLGSADNWIFVKFKLLSMKVLCDSNKIWFLKPNASLVSAVSVFDSRSRSLGFEVQVGPKMLLGFRRTRQAVTLGWNEHDMGNQCSQIQLVQPSNSVRPRCCGDSMPVTEITGIVVKQVELADPK